MTKNSKIKDDSFYKNIYKNFKKFRISDKKKSMKEICYPKKYKLQLPQHFVSNFINPKTPYKGLLIFHQIGAGKTCASVSIAEEWKKKKNILVVTPASLMGNYYKEVMSLCTGDEYIKPNIRKELNNLKASNKEYKEIIKKINKKIDKYYTIISYHKFVEKLKNKKINLKNTLLIIDEVQNIVSETGSFYKIINNAIQKSPNDLRIILLSGTPIFDKPVEIGLTMNLLKLPKLFPTGKEFNKIFLNCKKLKSGELKYIPKNLRMLKRLIKGYVSYYRGAPPIAFPKKNINIVKCKMSDYQYKSYKTVASQEGPFRSGDILKLSNNFFSGSRQLSNIAFPKKLINENGYKAFRGKHLQMSNLKEFSIKFYKILKKIKKSEGPVFVYSNFKEFGGLRSFIKVLKYHKFKSYKDHGEGKNRFAVWSGDIKHEKKDEIKNIFNQYKNKDGSKIKILLGSPSIKEGVTLLRVEQVHVMEPYWNMSRFQQIIGRAVRYCSHKDLPRSQRYVDIFLYIAGNPKDKHTVDKYILEMANNKSEIISEFEMALKESAIDCKLNYNGNVYNKNEHIKCVK